MKIIRNEKPTIVPRNDQFIRENVPRKTLPYSIIDGVQPNTPGLDESDNAKNAQRLKKYYETRFRHELAKLDEAKGHIRFKEDYVQFEEWRRKFDNYLYRICADKRLVKTSTFACECELTLDKIRREHRIKYFAPNLADSLSI